MTEQQQQLQELAGRMRDFQIDHGMTPKDLVREYSTLGSVDTFNRVLRGEWDNVNAERQLPNFQTAWGLMEMAMKEEEVSRALFDDIANVKAVCAAVVGAMREKSIARTVVVTGEYGRGKSSICDLLEAKWPNVTLRLNYRSAWGDSEYNFIGQLLRVANVRARKQAGGEGDDKNTKEEYWDKARREEELFKAFQRRRLILIVDEAHHLGPNGLNLLKSMINETEVVLVLCAIPKLLRKLEGYAFQEAKQLFTNRLYERIKLAAPNAADCGVFLRARGVTFVDAKTENSALKLLADAAQDDGKDGLHYLQKFCARARKQCGTGPLTSEQFVKVNAKLEAMYQTEVQ